MKIKQKDSIFTHLALAVTSLIVFIEIVLFVGSYYSKKEELVSLNKEIQVKVLEKQGLEIQPPLSESEIQAKLSKFSRNVFFLTLLIILTVVSGTLLALHRLVWRPVSQIISFNNEVEEQGWSAPITFSEEKIPNNEFGILIRSKNRMLASLYEKTQESLRHKEELESVLSFSENSPAYLFKFDENGQITQTNPRAKELFGSGGAFISRFDQVFSDLKIEDLQKLQLEGGEKSVEVTLRERYFVFYLVGIKNKKFINAYGIEVTDQKKTQKSIYESSKLASIGQLASGMGHEINNPLAIISGCVELLRIDAETPCLEDRGEQLSSIDRAVKRISKIISSLRSYAKSDSQKVEQFSVNDCVDSTLTLVKKIYENSGVQIHTELTEESCLIEGVFGKMQEVLLSLLSNSKDALEDTKKPEIRVKTLISEGKVLLEVSDNGSGIPEGQKSKIFDTFFTTKPAGVGTGLGLGVVKNFVKEFSGEVEFESEINKGTSFKLSFPLSEAKSDKNIKIVEKVKALVVEDESETASYLKIKLEQKGLDVDVCEDGLQAEKKIEENFYDFVFADIYMPNKNGYELLSWIREKNYKVGAVIFVTGGSGLENSSTELLHEPDALILKPFGEEELAEVLEEFSPQEKTQEIVKAS